MVDLAGNDYLGLSRHPAVTAAAAQAARTWGAGAGASRLVTGSLELHADLEDALAAFTGRPAALVFSTGYHANLAAVTALADRECLIVSDAHVHASLVDAGRLARAEVTVVPHNDVAAVSTALAGAGGRRAIVLVGVDLLRARGRRAAARAGRGLRGRTTRCCWSTRRTASASPAPTGADWSPTSGSPTTST